MLTDEVVEFRRGVQDFSGIAVGNQSDIDDIQNGLIGFVQLFTDELSTIGTECLVVEGELHFLVALRR